jgi:UDP-3-O-[3-hydroxymyristoyl] glucosamine N-acyltransferase
MNKTFPRKLPQPVAVRILVEKLGGYLAAGDAAGIEVHSIAAPGDAEAGSLVFINKAKPEQLLQAARETKASVIVASQQIDIPPLQRLVVTEDPLSWYIRALHLLFPASQDTVIHPLASVSKAAEVGIGVGIGPGSVVEDGCRIGDNCHIGSNCYLGPGTVLGDSAFVQDHAVIGCVGLGYHVAPDGERLFFPHLGAVLTGRDVVVGAGSVVVRGELEDTMIGDRVRLGNLVNIGHNVRIGADSVISSSTCVAGGTRIGERCNIAAGASISAKLEIGSGCQIGLGSVVVKNVPPGISVFGNPATPLRTMRRF